MDRTAIRTLNNWGVAGAGLYLIAGPCSAESEEQLLRTAAGLAAARNSASGGNLTFFRAGIWKPRTHPGGFQGIGINALPWLVQVRQRFGFAVGAEVGTPEHVEAALRHGLNAVWIGARTSVDPYAVENIAAALKGVDIPVLVKNPTSPDLELWLGALERVANVGIRRLAAVHRGFSTAVDTRYRNAPLWRIPIELKRRLPAVPLICDPSHLCGRTDLISPIAQEAMDLLFDGLMVEVHDNPAAARSDSAQQLTPMQFGAMLDRLVLPHHENGLSHDGQMLHLRHSIDEIDEEIVGLLARRMDVVGRMGQRKRQQQAATLQMDRWKQVLEHCCEVARQRGLSESFVVQLYQLIHEEAIRLQEEPLAGEGPDNDQPEHR